MKRVGRCWGYKYGGLLPLSIPKSYYHGFARGFESDYPLFLLLILSLAIFLSFKHKKSRAMRFLSSISAGVAFVGVVAGLVTPYHNTSTGILSCWPTGEPLLSNIRTWRLSFAHQCHD